MLPDDLDVSATLPFEVILEPAEKGHKIWSTGLLADHDLKMLASPRLGRLMGTECEMLQQSAK